MHTGTPERDSHPFDITTFSYNRPRLVQVALFLLILRGGVPLAETVTGILRDVEIQDWRYGYVSVVAGRRYFSCAGNAHLNPMPGVAVSGFRLSLLYDFSHRFTLGVLKLPPRTTRNVPLAGPCGFCAFIV